MSTKCAVSLRQARRGAHPRSTVIVHESVADEFCRRLKAHLPTMKAEAASPALRGVFSTSSSQRLDALVDDALAKGATILAGTRHVQHNIVQPLVLAGVTKNMRASSAAAAPRFRPPTAPCRHILRGDLRAHHHPDVRSVLE